MVAYVLRAHQPWALYMCERVPVFMFSDHTLLVTIHNSPPFAITGVYVERWQRTCSLQSAVATIGQILLVAGSP